MGGRARKKHPQTHPQAEQIRFYAIFNGDLEKITLVRDQEVAGSNPVAPIFCTQQRVVDSPPQAGSPLVRNPIAPPIFQWSNGSCTRRGLLCASNASLSINKLQMLDGMRNTFQQ